MKHRKTDQTKLPLQKSYSLAFKRKVVGEVESGKLTKDGARRKYDIGGKTTVLNWCRKYGKNSRKDYHVMVTTKKEIEEKESDKERIRELEKALADAHLKLHAHEIMLDIAKKEFGLDIRKKLGTKLPKK